MADTKLIMSETRLTMDQIAHLEKVPELWTDKKSATPGYICHDYLRLYEREWGKWRDDPIRLLEIGLNKGASIKVWLEYFENAHMYGVDIEPFKNGVGINDFLLTRFHFQQGDAGDMSFWELFHTMMKTRFEIIVDDGCHFSGPIHTAFQCLWPRIVAGGYYVVEDISEVLNPESHTAGFPDQIEFVHNLINPVIFGANDIDEVMISKDLVMIRKKA